VTIASGLRSGVRSGVRSGLNPNRGGFSLSAVTRDATSNIYCPASSAEWTQVMGVAGITSGGPSLLWLCQEASGNLADSIGVATGTVTGTGIAYRQAVSGWTRLAFKTTDTGSGKAQTVDASLPDVGTASMLLMSYVQIQAAPAAVRGVQGIGNNLVSRVSTTPRAQVLANATTVTGGSAPTGAVRPWVLQHNETASAQRLFTDQEKLSPAFQSGVTGKACAIGAYSPATGPSALYVYTTAFFGAAAELTDAQVKTLLQTLGWSIPWS
jgi:hypothetical protein